MGKSDVQIIKEQREGKGKGCAVAACIVAAGYMLAFAGVAAGAVRLLA